MYKNETAGMLMLKEMENVSCTKARNLLNPLA